MFGKSIYLSNFNSIKEMIANDPTELYFTSFHIAEEFNEEYAQNALTLLKYLKDNHKKVIADISPRGVQALNFNSIIDFIEQTKVDIIRCDFGFTEEEILKISEYASIAVNASTLDFELAKKLQKLGKDVYAIHNFYPRPETGLDEDFFIERNKELKKANIKIAAFISGDTILRGPIFEGLPTLEHHRYLPPYVQFAELYYKYNIDLILVGDPAISKHQQQLIIDTILTNTIQLPAIIHDDYKHIINKPWTVRHDSPNWLARLEESRTFATCGTIIEPFNCIERRRGAITMDNKEYLRYSGEIQIIKKDLSACSKVNVIGNVDNKYLNLLDLNSKSSKIKFIEKE